MGAVEHPQRNYRKEAGSNQQPRDAGDADVAVNPHP